MEIIIERKEFIIEQWKEVIKYVFLEVLMIGYIYVVLGFYQNYIKVSLGFFFCEISQVRNIIIYF